MRYKIFGKTGVSVSELSLGTWGIGGGASWDEASDEARLDVLAATVEMGINCIDTAPAYNAGESERYVGKALEAIGKREEMFISTKCGNAFINGAFVRNGDPDFIKGQCEESLKNLRTDYIDLYLLHWPDVNVPFSKTMPALQELKDAGKIRHVGVCNFSQAQMEEANQYCEIEVYQGHYSMVHNDETELMKWCHSQNIGVMSYGSLGAGILTGAQRELKEYAAFDSRSRFYKFFAEPMFSRVMDLLKVMDVMVEEKGVPMAQIAINWAAQKSFVSTTLVGTQYRHKLAQNVAAFDWMLSDEEMAILDEAVAVANAL